MLARFLLGMGLLLLLTGCPKKEEYPVVVPIGFLAPVSITPTSRTMRRGDTLWLTASFSDSLLDKNSGLRYRIQPQDLSFYSAILYEQLLGIGQVPVGIAGSFRIVEKIGHASVSGSTTGSFKPEYDGHYYRARIGLIPTKAGVTAISMLLLPRSPTDGADLSGKFVPFIQLPPDVEGRERKAVLDDSFYVINNGQATNFDLYSQNTNAFAMVPGTPPIQVLYETKSTFTVEVK